MLSSAIRISYKYFTPKLSIGPIKSNIALHILKKKWYMHYAAYFQSFNPTLECKAIAEATHYWSLKQEESF